MESIDLTGLWHFRPDLIGDGEGAGYGDKNYIDDLWRGVQVPSDFETCHPSLEAYEGGAWYRRTFSIPQEWRDRRIILHFEGVNARLKVWVNGRLAGEGSMPYLPFEFEIQAYTEPGDDNVIAVWVDNTRMPGEVPGMQRGWRTFGGILREINLYATDLLFLEGIITTAEPADVGGALTVRTVIRNRHAHGKTADLSLALYDKSGELWEQVDLNVPNISPRATQVIATDIAVAGAHLWSPTAPNLYRLEIALKEGDTYLERRSLRVGFRRIEARKDRLFLNGVPFILTGFNRHEDSITKNMCVDLDTARSDFVEMKDAGANFVRLCHYPHHPGEVDLCDELGLLVMDEIPLYWWGGLAEGEEACAHKLQAAKDQLTALIQRDRNHPSVIFWSVSNETEENRPEVVAGNDALVQLAQKLDPTRLAVHVSNHWQNDGHFQYDDVVCVNGYPTLNEQIMQRNVDFSAAEGGANWRNGLDMLHTRYPHKPLLVTEFGYFSLPGVYEGTGSEQPHAEVVAAEYSGMGAPYVCGATVWCWADHPWPPLEDQINILGISPYGIVARNRRKKRPYWLIRQLFREKQGITILPTLHNIEIGPAGYGVHMMRNNMENIPQVSFPEGYGIRPMRLDEGGLWTDIWNDADSDYPVGDRLFHDEFSSDYPATTWRSFIVTDPRGLGVGVISAWYNQQYRGELWGMIHWVALRRSVWGIGLGKAMMTHAMNVLAQWHDRAYLGTQTKRLPAIKNYLDFGFTPILDYPGALDAWREVAANIDHKTFVDLGLKDPA